MSFTHPIFLGFFDHAAVALGQVVVREPVDMTLASALLADVAPTGPNGFTHIKRDRFTLEEGYIRCWDIVRSRAAADFIVHFSQVIGCEILSWETRSILTADQFLSHFIVMEEWRRRRAAERAADLPPSEVLKW